MTRLFRLCIALVLLLGLARLLMAASSGTASLPTLGVIRQLAELVVLEAPMESFIVKRREGLVGGVELVLLARGHVLISTDLSQCTYAGIDETLRQATLVLPQPTVLWARLDSTHSRVHRLSRHGLWFMVLGDAGESELVELAWREAEQGFAMRGNDSTLIEQAKQQSQKVLVGFFTQLGWQVKVVWR